MNRSPELSSLSSSDSSSTGTSEMCPNHRIGHQQEQKDQLSIRIDNSLRSFDIIWPEDRMTIALDECNRRILPNYNLFCKLFGWCDVMMASHRRSLASFVNTCHVLFILSIMSIGYVMHAVTCYRQDTTDSYEILPPIKANESLTTDFEWNVSKDRPLMEKFLMYIGYCIHLWRTAIGYMKFGGLYREQSVELHNGISSSHLHRNLYTCKGVFGVFYVIPIILHAASFVMTMFAIRVQETNQFSNLTVLTYVMTTMVTTSNRAIAELKHTFCVWFRAGLAILFISTLTHLLHVYCWVDLCFTFLQPSTEFGLTMLKALATFVFSFLDLIIIANMTIYCIHCGFINIFLENIQAALRQNKIRPHDFTYKLDRLKVILEYLNNRQSLGVSISLFHIISRLGVTLLRLITSSRSFVEDSSQQLAFMSMLYWTFTVMMPLIQAARVTERLENLRGMGHELRSSTFYHNDIYTNREFESMLAYIRSLRMDARLFFIPISMSYIAGLLVSTLIFSLIICQSQV